MNKVINAEEQFQVLVSSMIISPSNEGYTLNYSAAGENFTARSEATPAGESCIVNGIADGTYFKLVGNQSEVVVRG